MHPIKTVTVIGANGTMGYNACAMFASFGNAKVFMLSRDIQKSRNSIDKVIRAVRSESIRKNLIACDYSQLRECVSKSDLVFESVSEDLVVKKTITEQVGRFACKDSIIATGTSGLSVNEIACSLPDFLRPNYYGMHFFNPPYNLPLLELIPTKMADGNKTDEIVQYLEKELLRTVVICKDSPAFLANRIGFQFLNLCLKYSEQYKNEGGIDFIDSIMGPFTGRAMAPCVTIDFVGLDVHKAIVDNIRDNIKDSFNDSFIVPTFLNNLICKGRLGRKTNSGLYGSEVVDNGTNRRLVFDISTGKMREVSKYSIPFADKMNAYVRNGDYKDAFNSLIKDNSKEALICKELLYDYVQYSNYVANEVCDDIGAVDDAMAKGFNWCPPLAMSNLIFGTSFCTKHDYRSYFRAVRQ